MNRREGLLAYFLVAAALIGALMSRAADTRKGDWTLHSSDEPGKVEGDLWVGWLIVCGRRTNPLGLAEPVDLDHPWRHRAARSLPHDAAG